MIAQDLTATRARVRSALGGLVATDEPTVRRRETLQGFLATQGSYPATAERLHLHKNSVRYRVDKAIDARGRPLEEDRLNLELALTACEWLGATVL